MTDSNKSPRPGEAALQNMKLLKTESSVFKVPKIPKTKAKVKKSTVLEEDEYVQGIAKIIQRDFFPDLEKLKVQNEYLEATENKDYARLREIARKYSGNRPPTEPYNSPATFDTPDVNRPLSPSMPTMRGQRSDTPVSTSNKPKDITDKHTLDSFLAQHTSEDNASYDRVISLENKKKAGKLSSQFEAEMMSLALVDAALALPSIEQQADQTDKPNQIDTWRYKAKNFIMYVPDGAESQKPPPKAELVHQNTRLNTEPFDHAKNKQTIEEIAKSQDASVAGKIGVDGATLTSSAPKYPFVATPSPRPGVGESPLMTWGEIEGTPFSLDASTTPLPHAAAGAAYKMLECGARERIALQLAEQVAKKRRPTTPLQRHNTPSFRTNTERLASMSPAARKLAAKHLLSPRLRLTPNDFGISHSASPKRTPTHRRSLVATPNVNVNVKTPVRSNSDGDTAQNVPANTLTDNLLQINVAKRSRLKAKDFFQ